MQPSATGKSVKASICRLSFWSLADTRAYPYTIPSRSIAHPIVPVKASPLRAALSSAAKRDAGGRTAGRHGAIIANGSRPNRSEDKVGKGIRSDNIGELGGQISKGERGWGQEQFDGL